jgi:predicted phosphoribosyltransferase
MVRRIEVFVDRAAAGVALAKELAGHVLKTPVIVLGLPRGGVAVAREVACALHAPLDVMLVRKVGFPGRPELAIGAIAWGNVVVHEREAAKLLSDEEAFERIAASERAELTRREQAYRQGREPLELQGKTVVLVDDGLATGSTMLAAIRAARKAGAAAVVVAAPVASPQAAALVSAEADSAVILETPARLLSIGEWYEDFEQLTDAKVCRLLDLDRHP